MKPVSLALVVLILTACARGTGDSARLQHDQQEGRAPWCFEDASETCGAGSLPRILPGVWSEQQTREFVDRSRAGTVAIALLAGQPRMVGACRLDGSYTEVNGTDDGARLWATNRLLLLPSEMGEGCLDATHLVAAFATRGSTFSAIMVPLPCASISETAPAARCVGKGATGAERAERVKEAIRTLPSDTRWDQDPAWVLEHYSIAPDYWLGLQLLALMDTECALREQAHWLASRYMITRDAAGERVAELAEERLPPREPAPRIDEAASRESCSYQPAFRRCFPDLFQPSADPSGCWQRGSQGGSRDL